MGLTIIDSTATDPYKRFGLDFSTVCYCDSPSLYIAEETSELIIFNYCEDHKQLHNIDNSFVFKIINMAIDQFDLTLTTDSNLIIDFKKVENLPIYKTQITGDFPQMYVGKDIKKYFTSEPHKFKKEDCGDFGG